MSLLLQWKLVLCELIGVWILLVDVIFAQLVCPLNVFFLFTPGMANLVSISLTFYEQLLCQNPFTKKLQTQIVSTLKLRKNLLYKKAARKILVKLTPIWQFHNFLQFFILNPSKFVVEQH
jgi:hypothetical protein